MTRFFRSVPNLEVIVHEQPWYPAHDSLGAAGRLLWRLERRQWLAAKDLCFHNESAVATYRERFRVSGKNARVVPHGRDFVPTYRGSRESALRELGLGSNRAIFASVGFITPYKGYELALDALAALPALDCEYHIVGSLHPQASAADVEYVRKLQQQAIGDPRVKLHLEFVDDAAFDRWMCAADAVLLPYRSSTSSSVLARCHLLGTPAIASRASGLQAELSAADEAVSDAPELAQALARTVRAARGAAAGTAR
jgi:glycosyltransferase involved in cell wall biosynthesis